MMSEIVDPKQDLSTGLPDQEPNITAPHGWLWWILVGLLILLSTVLVMAGVYWYLMMSSSQKKAVGKDEILEPVVAVATPLSIVPPIAEPLDDIPSLPPEFNWVEINDEEQKGNYFITITDSGLDYFKNSSLPGRLWSTSLNNVSGIEFNPNEIGDYYTSELTNLGWLAQVEYGGYVFSAPSADGGLGSVQGILSIVNEQINLIAWSYLVTKFDENTLIRNVDYEVFMSESVLLEELLP